MNRVWLLRGGLAFLVVAAALTVALWPGALGAATAGSGTLGRRELFAAMLTLGALGAVLYGFDLREWL